MVRSRLHDQTARISLQIASMSKSAETKTTVSTNPLAHPASLVSKFPFAFSRLRFRPLPSATTVASVRGLLRIPTNLRNPLFQKSPKFLAPRKKTPENKGPNSPATRPAPHPSPRNIPESGHPGERIPPTRRNRCTGLPAAPLPCPPPSIVKTCKGPPRGGPGKAIWRRDGHILRA